MNTLCDPVSNYDLGQVNLEGSSIRNQKLSGSPNRYTALTNFSHKIAGVVTPYVCYNIDGIQFIILVLSQDDYQGPSNSSQEKTERQKQGRLINQDR